ncbi:hypothetical protein [Nitrosomonas marina]|uniref:Uncharacterized protein n=1 Tax=Nitrosomonas marina TaxID=917 RepID=A0A1H8HNR2_9PROT|nr:hypothetical protein [Nitrosomonas marina]SEN57861.1 hypothetical protein SAMN05216325_12526 [Nitrosomonas marina]
MTINYKPPANYLFSSGARKSMYIKESLYRNFCINGSIVIALCTLFFISNHAFSNIIDDIKADMLLNEAELLDAPVNAGWAKRANITMGGAPRGDATPSWWQPNDKYYKSSAYWHAITPWFIIYPGTMHNASNVRVKISEIKLYILKRSSNTWELVNTDDADPTWQFHQSYISSSTASQKVNKRIEPDGKISFKLNKGLNPIHGGIHKYEIYGPDVKAVYAQLTTELVLDDPDKRDDRVEAQLLVSVGADYYPDMNLRVRDFTAPHYWVPAVAASRFGLVKRDPRIHHVATISPPGPIKNNGSVLSDSLKIIPVTEFEANPPLIESELDLDTL